MIIRECALCGLPYFVGEAENHSTFCNGCWDDPDCWRKLEWRDETMPRTRYRNGDPIDLACGCNSCSPSMINGLLCHETGCPDAWRDRPVECFECGCDFYPDGRYQRVCEDCANPFDDEDPDDEEED